MNRFRNTYWEIDSNVYFNSRNEAAIVLILRQDHNINAKMDFINFIYARKNLSHWKFYFITLPVLNIERYYTSKKDPLNLITINELSEIGKNEIIKGGYFKEGTCAINNSYIDKWYNPDLENEHMKFLNSK